MLSQMKKNFIDIYDEQIFKFCNIFHFFSMPQFLFSLFSIGHKNIASCHGSFVLVYYF